MAGATVLVQIITFTNVAAGATVVLPHGINVNGTPYIPDFAVRDNGNFDINSVTTTQISVTNTALVPQTLNVYLWLWHTLARQYGAVQTTFLVPRPFVPAASGSSGSGSGDPQRFVYVATGVEGTDFLITLPAARLLALYNVEVQLQGSTTSYGITCPHPAPGDRTTTQFRVVTTAALTAGDQLYCVVADPT